MNVTESPSRFNDLEKMSVSELLHNINNEDKNVPLAVQKAIPQIEKLVEEIVPRMKKGGRLFYIGAGTSGRLGILDASECSPTFGVPDTMVIGLIAGGEKAIRKAVEFAEDDKEQGWKDLKKYKIKENDIIIGLAASGYTPYPIGALEEANKNNILTGCITCNKNTPLAATAKFPIEVILGPEFLTGSTRMKSGSAQKLVLNMISTSVMIQLGRVKGNKMVDMQLTNKKLISRGIKMLMDELKVDKNKAGELLKKHRNVRQAIEWYRKNA
ncbi:MAG TPA: N-acetylmuramic acid 6-phosphate etherase [Cytophagaceae bacterium]|jgi:N-acetylmuramic acid 6-phosphate etherase|nr:N-acetylmuramic acid 6-phosphate etherase [Cytophagaceae bacterium]